MRTYKVTLFGHSYIRDLSSLEIRHLHVDKDYKVELRYLFRPGATIDYYYSVPGSYEHLFLDSPDVVFIFLGGKLLWQPRFFF